MSSSLATPSAAATAGQNSPSSRMAIPAAGGGAAVARKPLLGSDLTAVDGQESALKRKPSFQEVILRLQEYWSQQGCALLQPYDMEVGAGTSHTATFLRALEIGRAHV